MCVLSTYYPRDMQEVARRSKSSFLKIAMIQRGITARELSRLCGLSLSLIEKLMAGNHLPSPESAVRIEDALDVRLWSSPSEYKQRKARAEVDRIARSIMDQERIEELKAREIAADRYPHLFSISKMKTTNKKPSPAYA